MTTYTIPDLSVEIAWESPDDPTPSWIDVTDSVRAADDITITRGRSDERADGNQPGTLSLLLDNEDGRFTPGNSGSIFYPDVVPWRRIRVTLSTSSTVPLFYGYITQWSMQYADDTASAARVAVQAVDSLALLGRRSLRSVVSETILADAPVAYFPLDEPDGADRALDAIGGAPLTVRTKPGATGTVEFGAGTGPGTDEASAVTFTSAAGGTPFLGRGSARSVGAGWSYEAWINLSAQSTEAMLVREAVDSDGTLSGVKVSASGVPTVFYGVIEASGSAVIDDGRTHHVVATFTPLWMELYVDGASVASQFLASPTQSAFTRLSVGDSTGTATGTNILTVSHVAVYDADLTAGTVADHYAAGATGFAGESTWERIERWCSWVGVDVTNEGTGDGEALGHIPTAGRTALDCVADALRTDYGSLLLASREARALEFYDRTTRYEAVAAVTLDCSEDQVDGDLQVLMDPTYVASRVKATTPTGVYEARNAATEAVYGDLGMDVSVFPDDDGFAVSLAEGLGQVAASPVPRIPTVTTDLLVMALDSAAYDPTAIPEVGAAVSLTNLPPTAPDSSLDAFVEGLTETVSGSAWRRTASLSPAYPWLSTWLVEDPNGRGVIEAGNVIAL